MNDPKDEIMERWARRLRKKIYKCLKDQGIIKCWIAEGRVQHPRREFFEKFRQKKLF